MLLSKETKVGLTYHNIKKYLDLGYEFDYFINSKGNQSVKRGSFIYVKIEDLDFMSNALIKYECDYCGKEIEVRFCDYMRWKENIGERDACKECGSIKQGDNTFEKYGVRSQLSLKGVRDKINNSIKEKYGVDNVFELKETRDKIKATNLDNYGVENLFQSEIMKDKSKETCLAKYGHEYAMQNKDVCSRSTQNSMITRARLDKLPSSRQQEYLHKIYGGLKNHVVDNCALDIVLLEEMIDIEFDGSGHNLRVKMGNYTQEEFDRKEVGRKYYLKSKGWKDFRIISLKDKLPSDEVLLEMLHISKDWIGQGHSWIKFDIDNNTYETSKGIDGFDYGNLRKITDKDLI